MYCSRQFTVKSTFQSKLGARFVLFCFFPKPKSLLLIHAWVLGCSQTTDARVCTGVGEEAGQRGRLLGSIEENQRSLAQPRKGGHFFSASYPLGLKHILPV